MTVDHLRELGGRAPALRVGPEAWFLMAAAGLCTAALTVLATPGYWARPEVLAPAVTADLMLGLPALGYLFLVRSRRHGRWVLLPLFVLGLTLAQWWIPGAHQRLSGATLLLLALAEGIVIVYLALRAHRVVDGYRLRRGRGEAASGAMHGALEDALGRGLGGAVFTEASVLWYALAGWGRTPSPLPGTERFSVHRRNGYPAILGAILLMVLVETAAGHFLLRLWSPRVAWLASGLGVYSGLWLLGDFHAARRNPVAATARGLELSLGLRWRTSVDWSLVGGVRTALPDGEKGVRMTLFGAPDWWLELSEPVCVRGLFGMERRVRFLGVGVDEPERLRALVERRTVPGPGDDSA